MQVSGSSTVTETFDTGINWDDVYTNPGSRYTWNLSDYYPGPDYYEVDLGTHTVTIENISVAVRADPTMELGFSAVSKDGPADFLFTSDVLVFDTLIDAEACAEAYVFGLSGTSVDALDFPDKLFRTLYNGTEIFADMVDPYTYPEMSHERIDSTAISGEIESMQVMWSMTVNSGGHASGVGEFQVIPGPASILLLSLGGLALLRKRRG